MSAGLNIDPIYVNQICVLLILWLYGDLAGKGESASRFIDEGLIPDSHRF